MLLRPAIAAATERLAAAGIESARVDAELLAAHVLGCSRGQLLLIEELTSDQAAAFDALVTRRAERIPLQHLTGRAAFRRLEIAVGPGVLTPRPETELLVDAALAHLAANRTPDRRPVVLDLCSGSAAMTCAIAIEAGGVEVTGLELEPAAIEWGRRTVAHLGEQIDAAGSTVRLVAGDVQGCELGELADLAGSVDVVVSNPPYIPTGAVPRDPEVHAHEPAAALYGGADGMKFVDAVIAAAAALLRPGGIVIIEHGDLQGEAGEVSVPRLLRAHPAFTEVADHLDLAGRPRFTTGLRL